MQKIYEKPEVEITLLEKKAVVTASGEVSSARVPQAEGSMSAPDGYSFDDVIEVPGDVR